MGATDSETTVRKLSDIFEAGEASPIGKENRVRDVRDAKNLSPTSIFCGHDLMSANVRDVREDATIEPSKSETGLLIDIDSGLEVKVVCKNCGSWRRVPPDTLILTEPRCHICGSVMMPEPEDPTDGIAPTDQHAGDQTTDLAPTDQPLADPTTNQPTEPSTSESESDRYVDIAIVIDRWWQEVAGQSSQPAQTCPDCGSTLDGTACPTCGFPDEPLRRRIGRVMMAIAKALRTRHPNCRKTPCAQCRQVVARMNTFVISDDLTGLIYLWREVSAQ